MATRTIATGSSRLSPRLISHGPPWFRRTMTNRPLAQTDSHMGGNPARAERSFRCSTTDLSEKFEKISDRAKAATDELKAAGDTTRDQLETEVAGARDKATAAADQLKTKGRRRPRWRVVAVAGNPQQLALPTLPNHGNASKKKKPQTRSTRAKRR